MNFLNENFTSIDDLRKIDNIVNGLNKQREDIENLILEKGNGSNDDDLFEKVQLQAMEICRSLDTTVNKFLDNKIDVSDCLDDISALASKYGELELFDHVMKQVREIEELRLNQGIIKKYQSVFDEVSKLGSIDLRPSDILSKLRVVKDSIEAFLLEVVDCDLKHNILQTVNRRLSDIIVTRFKPVFMNSQSEYPSMTELKDLLALQSFDPLNFDCKPLWCLQLLIKENFELKFKYHYNSKVETNALDKPEWFFLFVQNWLSKNLDDLNSDLSKIFQNTIYENESFKEQYVSTIVHLVKQKIKKNLQLIFKLENETTLSNLLMHLIGEMLKNDDYFIKNFKIGINLVDELILSNQEITHRWLEFEKQFNFEKYNKIISSEEAFQIDFESVDSATTKPTNSAILVKNLLNNLTSKYRLIKNLNFKLKLLTQIQLRILERYYERMEELLDAFNSLFRKFKILSTKNEDKDLINGIQGIDRLLRIYCSLKYLMEAMEVWNEDLLFIQLSKLIREKTFFHTLIHSYNQLAEGVIKTIDEYFNKEINTTLRSYFKVSNWSNLSAFNNSMTPDLSSGLGQLSALLEFLSRALSQIDSIPIIINFEERLIKFFNDNILHLNTFNSNGALQIKYDFNQTVETLRVFQNLKSYLKLSEIFQFLSIVDASISVDSLAYSNYSKFNQICDQYDLVILKRDPQLLLSIARRKVL